MNILPKKRWHVRTKDNIARVRRDEAQAAEEEKKRLQRAKLAEQEARTFLLRTKARQNYDGGYGKDEPQPASATSATAGNDSTTTTTQIADIYTAAGNINFFKDLEEGKQTDGKNKEYEKEKKEEQEKYEKKIGYLTYLGQDSIEAQGKKAWYEEAAGRTTHAGDDGEDEDKGLQEVGLKSKDKLDPIHDIIKYGGIKPIKKVTGITKPTAANDVVTIPKQNTESKSLIEVSKSKSAADKKRKRRHKDSKKKKTKKSKRKREHGSDDEEESREKRNRHRHKRKRSDSSDEVNRSRKRRKTNSHKYKSRERERSKNRYNSSSQDSSSSNTSSSYESSEDEISLQEKKKKLEILRAERLKREAEERKRANRLLAGKKPDESDEPPKQPTIQQKYNSQFNPHIARQNQEPRSLETGVKYWLQ